MEADNIQVCVRVRPLNATEQQRPQQPCLAVDEANNRIVFGSGDQQQTFTYDHVGGEHVEQQTLFEKIAKPIADNCLKGYNGCIFAYGQTGSGKTFTIQGVEGDNKEGAGRLRGILPRVLEYLFAQIDAIERGVCSAAAALLCWRE